MAEGSSGTTVKDTWTKPRWGGIGREVGMAGVGMPEANADNCT